MTAIVDQIETIHPGLAEIARSYDANTIQGLEGILDAIHRSVGALIESEQIIVDKSGVRSGLIRSIRSLWRAADAVATEIDRLYGPEYGATVAVPTDDDTDFDPGIGRDDYEDVRVSENYGVRSGVVSC